jgi:hypothetical protein
VNKYDLSTFLRRSKSSLWENVASPLAETMVESRQYNVDAMVRSHISAEGGNGDSSTTPFLLVLGKRPTAKPTRRSI